MTTDNRTSEPKQTKAKSSQDFVFSEAQVEAAAGAIANADNHIWSGVPESLRDKFREYARAALVAAAGAGKEKSDE